MNGIDAAVLRRPVSGLRLWIALLMALAVAGAARLVGSPDAAVLETFVLIFTSIVVEALPFVLMGAVVSAVIEVYVPESAFARMARLPVPLQLPACALGGLAFPVCECGSIPVARRLIRRGLHPGAGVAFMLASPVLNPIVLASTAVAYGGRGAALPMVAGRAVLGLVLAVTAGWALGGSRSRDILRARSDEGEHAHASGGGLGKRRALHAHLVSDFIFMGRFVVLGAAIAAALQTLIPQSIVSGVARTPLVGSLALMGLAFVLSLCSEADAFVAVSLIQFPASAQLAFLVFGPVADTKLTLLYGATFRDNFVVRLLAVAIPVVLAGSLWFEVFVR